MTLLFALILCSTKARLGVVSSVDAKSGTITFKSKGENYRLSWAEGSKVKIDGLDSKPEKVGRGDAGSVVFDDDSASILSIKLTSKAQIDRQRKEEQDEIDREEERRSREAQRRRQAEEEADKADEKDRKVQQDIRLRIIDDTDRFTGARRIRPSDTILIVQQARKFRVSCLPVLVISDEGARANGFQIYHFGSEWRYLRTRRVDFLIDGKKPRDEVEVTRDGEVQIKFPQISETVIAFISTRDFFAMTKAKTLEMRIGDDVHTFDPREIQLLGELWEQSKKASPP